MTGNVTCVFFSILLQDIETLRSQLYVQSSEINRLQTERMELLQKIEANVSGL